ncbi:ATP-binding protein [Edaphocola aurantiacus]|uniref:ATP-binding protein n=1 Tax=Edaphocola aurantiacus TaxID=2601682 RepID=UPI001C975389|nr:tetratricopeptide repeat-containing sensor histidine kinase [Edaphocola aurantiacus]
MNLLLRFCLTVLAGILCSALFLPPIPASAQLSQATYDALPPVLKPQHRSLVTFNELTKILNDFRTDDSKVTKDLTALCLQKIPFYATILDRSKRSDFLFVSVYWLFNQRYDIPEQRTLIYQYIDTLISEVQSAPDLHLDKEGKLGICYMLKGGLYAEDNKYMESYESHQKSLDIFKEAKGASDLSFISNNYTLLAAMYSSLLLHDESIAYVDRALATLDLSIPVIRQTNKPSLIIIKAKLYFTKLLETNKAVYADSVASLIRSIDTNDIYTYIKPGLYCIEAGLAYWNGCYDESVAHADAALSFTNINVPEHQINSAKAFKGLSLLKMGNHILGRKVLESIDFRVDSNTAPIMGIILELLATHYKAEGNYAKSNEYYTMLLRYKNTVLTQKYQGELFQISRKYNVAARDAVIHHLNAEQKLNRWIMGAILFFALLIISAFYFRYRNNKKEKVLLLRQIEEQTEFQVMRIEQSVHKVKEEERRRFGQELHDDFAGSLAGIVHLLKIREEEESDLEKKTHLSAIYTEVEAAYSRARMTAHNTYHTILTDNFQQILTNNIHLFFNGSKIKSSVYIDDLSSGLDPELQISLFFIVKEAITNIIKHSRAQNVDILIYEDESMLVVQIKDNGKGIYAPATKRGIGLRSIEERVNKHGGNYKLFSPNNIGTTLEVILPMLPCTSQ